MTRKRPYLAFCREAVASRMEAGEPFGEVEDMIELADVTDDQRAALWLMAFSMRDRRDQERTALGYFALVAGH